MKYPLIDMVELTDSFQFYAENTNTEPYYKGNSVEEWADEIIGRAEKNDKLLKQIFITYRDNKDLILDDSSLEVINKILGDKKTRSKCRIVHDGSYLNNRIWVFIHADADEEGIKIRPEINFRFDDSIHDYFDKLPAKKKIDWIANHFDTIFVQPISAEDRIDILSAIEYDKFEQEIDMMFEDDYYGDDYDE